MAPSLASRLLFHSATNQPLPVLFDTKNAAPELTPEIYDFIALALRAFVSPWWSKITRYDKDFLPHISAILTKVIRALDQRAQTLDLPELVFRDAPTIITQHYRDYRNAAAKVHTAYATGGAASLPFLFAHLQPHMAISPDGTLDREYYRQIVDHILKACLPPEDYEPEAERLIIREVIVKVLIDDVIPKITQPWFINRTILDLVGSPEEHTYITQPAMPTPTTSTSHNFIVLVLSILQSFSGMCLALIHTYKQAMTTIKLVQQSPPRTPQPSFTAPPPILPPPPPEPIIHAPSLTSARSTTSSTSSSYPSTLPNTAPGPAPTLTTPTRTTTTHQQNYASQPLTLLSEIVSSHDRLSSTTTLTLISTVAASMTPFLDKLLPHMLYDFLSPAFVLNTARTAKRTLFPNGYPGPQPPIPSPEEQAEWRAKLVAWRGKGTALDPLSDAQCNLHLVVFLLDRILVGLFPELAGAPS
ncbi:hypothetical protein GALMADRAFT_53222 [Galerina marginata CBS 339.88]|uniref:PXA domain-containing protein n=1 Tax=Galerina marginata (strain CBS 339.88) TaxID=685588 RepID=A0A067TYW5_GALM3|nr:hypothetical protein GALMADRAFT_53222 [Galerina marginata CBS 339.88]